MSFFRQFICDFVLVLVVSTAAIFFLPITHGSYSTVHGPIASLHRAEAKPEVYATSVGVVVRNCKQRSFVCDSTPHVSATEDLISRSSRIRSADVLRL